MGVMQDEPAIGPFVRPVIRYRVPLPAEILGRSGANRPSPPRRDRGRDPPAPGHDRLLARTIRIGQPIARQLLHQDERIKHRLAPRLRNGTQSFDDRPVRRRPAIDRPVVHPRDLDCGLSADARNRPGHFGAIDLVLLDLGLDRAAVDPQVAAEPGHDQRHRPDIRQLAPQNVHRGGEIRSSHRRVNIRGPQLPQAQILVDRRGRK